MDGWVRSRFHQHNDGSFTVERVQDVEAILDRNKAFQNEPQKKSEFMGHHIATIPNVIIDKWAMEDGANLLAMDKHEADRYLRKKLRDPDWRWLKTR